jgi:hypothetical protein
MAMKTLLLVACFSTAAPGLAQTLVAHYMLDETTGNVCADSSGNGQDGMYRNSFTLGRPGVSAGCGTAVDFDAASLSDVSIYGNALQGLTADLSVSAWIRPEDLPAPFNARRVFGNNNGGWMCGVSGDGLIFTTRFIQDYVLGSQGLQPLVWTHVAFVFDANYDVTFYINGASVGSIAGAAPANPPNPEWFIGGFNGVIEFWNGELDDIQVYAGALTAAQVAALYQSPCSVVGGGPIGAAYCGPAAPNSTGQGAVLGALGSAVVAQNNLTLEATSLPSNSFGFFLTSATQGFVGNPGGSQGNLCLGGAIGRYVGPGQIKNSGSAGTFSLPLNLALTPTPSGFVSVFAGQTRNYQAWFRDAVSGSATSNFTQGLAITFL